MLTAIGLGLGLAVACGSDTSPEETCALCLDEVVACHKSSNGKYRGSLCLPSGLTQNDLDYNCTVKWGLFGAVQGEYSPCNDAAGGTLSGDPGPSDSGPGVSGGADSTGAGASPTSCVEWRSEVTDATRSAAGVYYIQESFLDALANNPSPLVNCDGARVEPLTTGRGYKVVGATGSTLLYKWGLRNGDEVTAVNGMALYDYIDGAQAFGNLIVNGGTTTFALTIKRTGQNTTINYVLE